MSTKRLLEVQAEMELIRSQLEEIEALPEPDGDEALRSQIAAERETKVDDLIARFKDLKTELGPLQKRAEELDAIRSAARDIARVETGDGAAASRSRYLGGTGPQVMRHIKPYEDLDVIRSGVVSQDTVISRALAANDQAPEHLSDGAREKIASLLEDGSRQAPLIARHMLLTGSPEYHQQFREYVENRGMYAGEAIRAAMSLTDANGGVLVPFTLDPTIILTNSGIQGSIRSISTIKTIVTNDWNGVTSAGVTAEWLGEGSEAADASPTFVQPTITPKKAAAWVFGSYEVLADSGFASELQMLLADAKVRLEEAAFATANTGASQPRGVVAAALAVTASIVTAAATNAFAVGDVYNTSDALRPRDAAQASWIANKKIFSLIRRFDTSGGGSFWTNIGMGRPNELLGQPVYECSTMTGVVSTGANVLLAGNFKQYYIVDRVGMSIMYEPMVKSTGNGRPTGQAGWFAFWRVGADVVDADAFRVLQLNQVAAAVALA